MKIKLEPKRAFNVAAGTFSAILIGVLLLSVVAATVLVPYIIESWGTWMGYHPVIQWWKGILIFLAVALFTRYGALGTAIVAAVITGLFDVCGFAGF